mgnify:CR=1 FL=1
MNLLLFLLLFCSYQSFDAYITIEAGTYTIGKTDHPINEQKEVYVDAFKISATEITNEQFLAFIEATAYETTAEIHKNAMTFEVGLAEFEWLEDSTAYWRFPFGTKKEGIENKMNHPVTCISFIDVLAYCEWANERLPTLAEWEIACRANSKDLYFWGKDASKINEYGNIWTNATHQDTLISDQHLFTSPVGIYAPNAWGLHDMYGNVFEFCADTIPNLPDNQSVAYARGGSWWCSSQSCNYFNSIDIGRVHRYASFSNHGFRTVKRK